ncbi:MAG: hypothetical protein ACNA8J_09070, partial [Gammaproteobacteria bacterium]
MGSGVRHDYKEQGRAGQVPRGPLSRRIKHSSASFLQAAREALRKASRRQVAAAVSVTVAAGLVVLWMDGSAQGKPAP